MKDTKMLDRLLPSHADNNYRGYKVALWLFGAAVFLRSLMSANSIIMGRQIAKDADGIPLDAYAPAAAQTIVAMFGLLGVVHLSLCILCILVLVRYRTLVPLMFLLLLVQFLAGRVVLRVIPIARTGTPPGLYANLVLAALLTGGLLLSLAKRASGPPALRS